MLWECHTISGSVGIRACRLDWLLLWWAWHWLDQADSGVGYQLQIWHPMEALAALVRAIVCRSGKEWLAAGLHDSC